MLACVILVRYRARSTHATEMCIQLWLLIHMLVAYLHISFLIQYGHVCKLCPQTCGAFGRGMGECICMCLCTDTRHGMVKDQTKYIHTSMMKLLHFQFLIG